MGEDSPNIQYLGEKFPGRILASHAFRGDETIVIPREGLQEIFSFLKEDPGLDLNFLTDITAVDYLGKKEPRFEVVYHLYSFRAKHRLRVKVPVPEANRVVDSLTPSSCGAGWLESPAAYLFRLRFRANRRLRRVLLY